MAELLGADVTPQRARRSVSELRRRALAWGEDDELAVVPTARESLPAFPAGLGRPADGLTVEGARAALADLDEPERDLVGKLAGPSPIGRTKDAARGATDEAATPVQRLLAKGLLLRRDDETVELPRQLAFAIRGDHPMGPVEPEEPLLDLAAHDQSTVDSTAAGEVLELLRHLESLLHLWSEDPPCLLYTSDAADE